MDNLTDGDGGLYELLLDGQDYLAAVRSRNALWDQRRLEQVDRDSQTQSSQASQMYSQDFQTALEQGTIQAATAAAQASVQATAQSSASLATGYRTQPPVSLPKMKLPTFAGGILRWPEFWEMFSASVDQQAIDDVNKCNYLVSCLKDDAQKAVSGISITAANYSTAVRILQEKFVRQDVIVDMLYAKLQLLRPASSSKLADFKDVHASLEAILRQVETHGENLDQRLIVNQILGKFPRDVVVKLEERRQPSQPWTTADLRAALYHFLEIQENADRSRDQCGSSARESDQHSSLSQPVASADALATQVGT